VEEGYEMSPRTTARRRSDGTPRNRRTSSFSDRKLPKLSGDEVCRRIRASSTTPILMLTASAVRRSGPNCSTSARTTISKSRSAGGELRSSRSRSVASRDVGRVEADGRFVGRLRWIRRPTVASVDGDALDLTPTEFRLLTALITRPGEVLERALCCAQGGPKSATRIPSG